MTALYITSVGAGKTAFCAGIGAKLLDHGIKVGFIIPVQIPKTSNADGYKDATFIKEIFQLAESTEMLCPIHLSRRELWQSLTDEVADFKPRLQQAYRMVSQGKEIVIMEGLGELDKDKVSALACYTIAETLEAKVVILLSSSWALNPSKIMQICKKLGRQLLGVVINFVPESKIEAVRQKSAALFNGVGIKVLGVLPEVRSLLGVRVGELAQILGGEILTAMESTDEMIENIMLGAMTPDSGVDYFSRQPNKAAVIRGERADMQLAALETSTRCLILTNGVKPLPAVMSRAEEKHIPTILVNQDISAAIIGIEEAIANANFRSSQKLRRFAAILEGYFDFKALYSGLGLKA